MSPNIIVPARIARELAAIPQSMIAKISSELRAKLDSEPHRHQQRLGYKLIHHHSQKGRRRRVRH